ncbi:AmmeMemoRadiSam system protein A [Candidatus Falkowbacteria bacterium]|nr:AmmeMemoRadiSam system protein A [Candidatus Falkowbacteria bacterium]
MQFDEKQKKELLKHARRVLTGIVKDGKKIEELPPDSCFLEKAGVFVSLHKNDELRGCVGYIEPIANVWDAVRDNAVSSSTADFRFEKVESEELDEIKIEISILTPPTACAIDEIEQGKDGVIIEQGGRKATYLPQVWESLNEPKQFFSSLCEKAGFGADCWQDKTTKFFRYNAIVFSE